MLRLLDRADDLRFRVVAFTHPLSPLLRPIIGPVSVRDCGGCSDTEELIIDLGDVITAGGGVAWLDLGLGLIDRYLGPPARNDEKRRIFFAADPAGRQQRLYATFSPPIHHGDAAVLRVQVWLQTNAVQTTSIEIMAAKGKAYSEDTSAKISKSHWSYAHRIRVVP
jgi:hypothetical protein